MATAFDLMEQAKWEVEGTRRAARRYREAAATADPSTLPSGQKLLRELVPPLVEKITELQLKAADSIASRGRKPSEWAWPIQLLDASALAVITIVQGLNAARGQTDALSNITSVALGIASAVRDELEYRRWVSAQVAANKAAKEAKDWDHVDVLAAFKRRYPAADRKTWARWRKKIELAREERWDRPTSVALGAALISALVEAAPGRFEVAQRAVEGGRKQSYLRLSEETMGLMNDIEVRAEVARPQLMPMIIPPIPWQYEEAPK